MVAVVPVGMVMGWLLVQAQSPVEGMRSLDQLSGLFQLVLISPVKVVVHRGVR